MVSFGWYTVWATGEITRNVRRHGKGRFIREKGVVRVDTAHHDGYRRVQFRNRLGRSVFVFAHRIVWAVHRKQFIPTGGIINHDDGDKSQNAIRNLVLTDTSGNVKHAVHQLGRRQKTPDDVCVLIAKALSRGNDTLVAIAASFGVSVKKVNEIRRTIRQLGYEHTSFVDYNQDGTPA